MSPDEGSSLPGWRSPEIEPTVSRDRRRLRSGRGGQQVRVGRWAAPAAALAAVLTLVGAAGAITYGAPDGTNGITHPYVGALIATNSKGQKQLFCSGSLIAPTVFLTAAHCTAELEAHGVTQVWVTFDQQFSSTSRLIAGTMHTDPLFGGT